MLTDFCTNLFAVLLLVSVLFGGVNVADAQERHIFRLQINNPVTKIRTYMDIYAENELAARDYATLNGWQVLEAQQLTFEEKEQLELEIGVQPVIDPEVYVPEVVEKKEDEPEKAPPEMIEKQFVSDVEIKWTPDNKNLKFLFSMYFKLGSYDPDVDNETANAIGRLSYEKKYVLFGHTDIVPVSPTADYADNYELSFLRAFMAKEKLTERGMNTANLTAIGVGPLYPDAPEAVTRENGVPLDRRVDIYEVLQEPKE